MGHELKETTNNSQEEHGMMEVRGQQAADVVQSTTESVFDGCSKMFRFIFRDPADANHESDTDSTL